MPLGSRFFFGRRVDGEDSSLGIMQPKHVLSGFVDTCMTCRVLPFYTADLRSIYDYLINLIRIHTCLFGDVFRNDSSAFYYFYHEAFPCLKSPYSLLITDSGERHYQASLKYLPQFLGCLPVLEKAMASEFGREFFDNFSCDSRGRVGKHTPLFSGDLERLF